MVSSINVKVQQKINPANTTYMKDFGEISKETFPLNIRLWAILTSDNLLHCRVEFVVTVFSSFYLGLILALILWRN